MKKFIIIGSITTILLISLVYFLIPDNVRVKKFGGTATIELKSDVKLVNVTWKDSELWLLTRKRNDNDTHEIYNFTEQSKWGLLEGNYTIIEK